MLNRGSLAFVEYHSTAIVEQGSRTSSTVWCLIYILDIHSRKQSTLANWSSLVCSLETNSSSLIRSALISSHQQCEGSYGHQRNKWSSFTHQIYAVLAFLPDETIRHNPSQYKLLPFSAGRSWCLRRPASGSCRRRQSPRSFCHWTRKTAESRGPSRTPRAARSYPVRRNCRQLSGAVRRKKTGMTCEVGNSFTQTRCSASRESRHRVYKL